MSESNARSFRLLTIETRFETLARRPGGVPRNSAIATANSNIAATAPDFCRALTARIEKLEKSLNDDVPDSVISATGPFMSEINELRDIGAIVGFPSVTLIAGELCRLFDKADGGTRNATVGCFVRSLSLCMRREYRHTDQSEVQRLVTNLKDLTAKELSRGQMSTSGHSASCVVAQ